MLHFNDIWFAYSLYAPQIGVLQRLRVAVFLGLISTSLYILNKDLLLLEIKLPSKKGYLFFCFVFIKLSSFGLWQS